MDLFSGHMLGLTFCGWVITPCVLYSAESKDRHSCIRSVIPISMPCIRIIEFSINFLCDYRYRYDTYHVVVFFKKI